MRWSIDKTATAGFALALATLLVISVFSIVNTQEFVEASRHVVQTEQVLTGLENTLATVADAETGARGYVVTGDESFLEPYQAALDHIAEQVGHLQRLTADNPGQQARVASLERRIARKLGLLKEQVVTRKQKGFEPAQRLVSSGLGEQAMDDIRGTIREMAEEENALLKRRQEAWERRARHLTYLAAFASVVAALLLLVATLATNREIAARRRAEERLRGMNAELAATNRELEAFTYSVSHDLRAPLRHIDGFSKLLLEEHGPALAEEAQHYLTRVREGVQQMGRLVDDLLNLSRVGRSKLNVRLTGLNSVVQAAVEELRPEAEGRQIQWQVRPLPFTECDPALIKQVFSNLISNALKYTRPRERAVIEVGALAENGVPVIYVRDNGIGFDMRYAQKLFGIFQRLHRQEDFEGTGVGLATVERIIHKHGGRVWAEAELNKGATFYFTFGTEPVS